MDDLATQKYRLGLVRIALNWYTRTYSIALNKGNFYLFFLLLFFIPYMKPRGRLSRAETPVFPLLLKSQAPFSLLSLENKYFLGGLFLASWQEVYELVLKQLLLSVKLSTTTLNCKVAEQRQILGYVPDLPNNAEAHVLRKKTKAIARWYASHLKLWYKIVFELSAVRTIHIRSAKTLSLPVFYFYFFDQCQFWHYGI